MFINKEKKGFLALFLIKSSENMKSHEQQRPRARQKTNCERTKYKITKFVLSGIDQLTHYDKIH